MAKGKLKLKKKDEPTKKKKEKNQNDDNNNNNKIINLIINNNNNNNNIIFNNNKEKKYESESSSSISRRMVQMQITGKMDRRITIHGPGKKNYILNKKRRRSGFNITRPPLPPESSSNIESSSSKSLSKEQRKGIDWEIPQTADSQRINEEVKGVIQKMKYQKIIKKKDEEIQNLKKKLFDLQEKLEMGQQEEGQKEEKPKVEEEEQPKVEEEEQPKVEEQKDEQGNIEIKGEENNEA